ncbi:Cytochrome c heme lyase subunit CcmF [hydrothermal vent metagenome]|uniref:Cytochrome c heme lyase subunit CcmF n=1 Tax=hydrothermal vent metagenome TaxID=652676 RepID=A0A3B1DHB8_9ZZZZ
MTRWAGEFGLIAAVLIAGFGIVSGLLAWRSSQPTWCQRAKLMLLIQPIAIGLAVIAMLVALVQSDMGTAYVAHHTERALPMVFKITALWAGQEGSLLCWGLMVAVVGMVAAWTRQTQTSASEPITLAVLAGANLFFALLLVVAARPFAPTPHGPLLDGWGLNPALQHWAMVVHPPLLLFGYTCTLVPFAAVVGAMVAGETDTAWSSGVRRWVLAAWVCLTGGILLGAWWAYMELGWGGYWAWDPVENASLLPWFAATGLLHTIRVSEDRGIFRGWAAVLACLALLLCLVGTLLTRSGLLQSVHAYGQHTVAGFLLGLVLVVGLGAGGLLVWRRRGFQSAEEIESMVSREGVLLALNWLMVAMIGATLWGTIFPIVSGLVLENPASVSARYYNRVVVPMGLAAAALMALGPLLVYGKEVAGELRRGALAPGVLTGVGLVIAAALGVRHVVALLCLGIALMTVLVIAFGVVAAVRGKPPRVRVGLSGPIAHVGMVLLILGVCGSSLFAVRGELDLGIGESGTVSGLSLEFSGLREVRGENYSAMEAVVIVRDRREHSYELLPQRRYYDKSTDPAFEVAVRTGLGRDLLVTLIGWPPEGDRAVLQVLVNPLTAWIWIGGGTMVLGGVLGMGARVPGRANNRWQNLSDVESDSEAGCAPPTTASHQQKEASDVQNSG